MKKCFAILFTLLTAVSCIGCGFLYEREYYEDSDIVFGTDLTIDVWLLGRKSPQAFQQMVDELRAMDAEISLTRPESALSRLNAAVVGETVEVGKHAYALWELATRYYTDTDGAFNPCVVDLSVLWGIDANASSGFGHVRQEPLPDYSVVVQATEAIGQLNAETGVPFGVDGIKLDGRMYFKKLSAAAQLDFGSIAKGYAADLCIEIAKEYGISSAIIDLSGNIKTFGQFVGGSHELTPFTVSVIDPRSHGLRGAELRERLFVLTVPQTEYSVVVSGDYERYYEYIYAENDVVPVCHILDPFSGMPLGISHQQDRYMYDAQNAVISAVVVAESSALADALTTAVCVMGFEAGSRFLQERGIRGAVMTQDRLAFVGISEGDLYKPSEYGTYVRYGAQIEFLELSV